MTVSTFPSRYGSYAVTRAVIACPPEITAEGTTKQRVLIFETTDQAETVSICGKTLFLLPCGHKFQSSYDGQRRTSLKHCARRQYSRALAEGYEASTDLIY